jgi:hypothetical protein
MREHGIDPERLYFDVPRMRSAYPLHFLSSGIAYAFYPHRDTWYSAPMSQLNWWLPIYPIEPDNSLGFYPRYFNERVKNNSEIYNYYEWNTKHRATAAQHVRSDTREQPKPQQKLESVTMRFLPPPGGLILFSTARDRPQYDEFRSATASIFGRSTMKTSSPAVALQTLTRDAPVLSCATI